MCDVVFRIVSDAFAAESGDEDFCTKYFCRDRSKLKSEVKALYTTARDMAGRYDHAGGHQWTTDATYDERAAKGLSAAILTHVPQLEPHFTHEFLTSRIQEAYQSVDELGA